MANIDPEIARDFANALNSLAQSISELKKPTDEFARSFEETSSVAKDLSTILGRIVMTSKELPKEIKTTNDLMGKMLKDEKLFEKIKKQAHILQAREIKEYYSKKVKYMKDISGLGWKEFKQSKELKTLEHSRLLLEQKKKKELNDQFQKLKEQGIPLEKQKKILVDIKGAWETVGSAIKNPSRILDGIIAKMSEFATKGKEAFKGFGAMLGSIFSPAGLVIGGLLGLVAVFTSLFNFLDKKVLPATADFNKQIGNMGTSTKLLRQEMYSAGQQFERLGLSFDEGSANVRDFAEGMMLIGKPTRKELDKTIQTGLKLTQVVGLSAQQSGKLSLFFEKSEGSLGGLNKAMNEASVVAHKYQIPVNQIRRDLGDDLNILARFGTRNRMVMLESAARARTYGLSIKEINSVFGEQMDSFDKTSDVAAKLNAIFGTHINSYRLMLETDPTKRMEMLRKELLQQGKSWDKLNVFEQNIISSSLGVSKEQAALALSSDKVRTTLEAQAKEQARTNKLNMDWEKGLQNIKRTMIPWLALLEQLMQAFARAFGIALTGKDAGKSMQDFASKVEQGITKLTSRLNKFAESPGGSLLASIFGWSDDAKTPESKFNPVNTPGVARHVHDALITKTGQVVKFNPQDNIVATKSPISRTSQGAVASAGKATMSDQNIIITPAPVIIDGQKIAEIIFRQTRR